MSVLFAILLFSVLILLHELGHFVAAKASCVQVNEFSMFMGPAIFKKKVGETLYSLRCIPIGGYCAMEGEDSASENPHAFQNAAWWKRLIILVAGSAMNFLTGLVLLGIVYGGGEQIILPVVDHIEPASVFAEEGGFQPGDRILKLDGERLYVHSDFSMILSLNPGDVHDIVVERDGQKVYLNDYKMELRPFENEDGTVQMRYGFSFKAVDATFGDRLAYVWNNAVDILRLVRLSLQMLLTGNAGFQDVMGPVGIVQQISVTAAESPTAFAALINLLYFGAFLAINLAAMNMLPFPALDGGRVVCLLLTVAAETITGKKIDPKYEGYLHAAGMILLLALMAVVTFKDVFTIFKG